MAAEKRPVRPKVIDFKQKATLDYVSELAGRGMYEKDIAECLGYSTSHFRALKGSIPALSAALKEGNARGLERVTGKLMDNIDEHREASIFFYLKCKAGWRDNAGAQPDDSATANSESFNNRVLERLSGSNRSE